MNVITKFLIFLLAAPALLSQTLPGGVIRGTVRFEDWTIWGQVTIPRGCYSLVIEYAHVPVKVTAQSENGKKITLSPLAIFAGTESGDAQVCLSHWRGHWAIRSIDLPSLGISLLFMPRNTALSLPPKCLPILKESHGPA